MQDRVPAATRPVGRARCVGAAWLGSLRMLSRVSVMLERVEGEEYVSRWIQALGMLRIISVDQTTASQGGKAILPSRKGSSRKDSTYCQFRAVLFPRRSYDAG